MSGSNTTSSGTPISDLPLASSVAATDTLLGIVGGGSATGGDAHQVSVEVLGSAVSSAAGIPDAVSSATAAATQADAAAKKAYDASTQAVQNQAGVAGGVAQLDQKAQLYLQGQSALAVTPATSATSGGTATPAMLTPLLPLHPNTGVGPDGETLGGMATQVASALQKSSSGQPGGYVPLDESSVGQFTKSGFVIPMREGDLSFPMTVGYYANWRELTFTTTTPGGNVVAFENLASNGYAAITFRGPDVYRGTSSFEHGAIGYGPTLQWGMTKGYTFWEISAVDGSSSSTFRSVPGIIQETGAHFTSFSEAQIVFNSNSNTIKTLDGSTFPAGVNGQIIVSPTTPDAFARDVTIVSGEGTDTLTVSSQILVDSRDKTVGDLVRFGPSTYTQADSIVFQSSGNFDIYRFQDAYNGVPFKPPFFSVDRVAGRFGINRPDPKTDLHVVGQAVFATTSKWDQYSARFNAAISASVVPGGSAASGDGSTGTNSFLYVYGYGKNALLGNWTAANEVQLIDANSGKPLLTVDMAGSGRMSVEQILRLPTLSKAGILAIATPKDGDCVMCSDLGVPVVYSAVNTGWFPLTVGAKISA